MEFSFNFTKEQDKNKILSCYHNGILKEIDITESYRNGSLWDRIQGTNGYKTMDGIYPGCWIEMNHIIMINKKYYKRNADTIKYIIVLECNTHKELPFNHIVCCPLHDFGGSSMNMTSTNFGGYFNSYMNLKVLGNICDSYCDHPKTVNEYLYNEFGNHLKTFPITETNAIGETINHNVQSILMSDENILSEKNGDLFSLLNLCEKYIRIDDTNRDSYWLRNTYLEKEFFKYQYHYVMNYYANGQSRIRPYFILG